MESQNNLLLPYLISPLLLQQQAAQPEIDPDYFILLHSTRHISLTSEYFLHGSLIKLPHSTSLVRLRDPVSSGRQALFFMVVNSARYIYIITIVTTHRISD
ncbi:hypothetical protein HK11_08440 [Acetobacter sp. DmW_043]|nr:hypothetical protein HK11_08440 [Acetobacter sp. DmW_043]